MTAAETQMRPWTVTTVVVLVALSGVIDIIGGIALWFFSGSDSLKDLTDAGSGELVTVAVVSIILGIVTVGVALALSGGSNGIRMLVAALMAIRIVLASYVLVAYGTHQMGEAVITIVVAVTTLALLFNEKANAFFAGR